MLVAFARAGLAMQEVVAEIVIPAEELVVPQAGNPMSITTDHGEMILAQTVIRILLHQDRITTTPEILEDLHGKAIPAPLNQTRHTHHQTQEVPVEAE